MFMDLHVEVEGDKGEFKSLRECLKSYTQGDDLDGVDKYHCSRCDCDVRAHKKLSILQSPNIMCILLKRFKKLPGNKFAKLNNKITYPPELDLSPYMETPGENNLYELYGVVVHLDFDEKDLSHGHYICYNRGRPGNWFKIDDTKVDEVCENEVLNELGYILFYRRKTTNVNSSAIQANCAGTSKLSVCIESVPLHAESVIPANNASVSKLQFPLSQNSAIQLNAGTLKVAAEKTQLSREAVQKGIWVISVGVQQLTKTQSIETQRLSAIIKKRLRDEYIVVEDV